MILPGWNSIEATDLWASIYFWVSIGALILLGVAEVASHFYTLRHDSLVAASYRHDKYGTDSEIARLHKETTEAQLALAKYRAQRALLPDAQKQVAEALKQYAGTIFDAGVPVGDTECSRLLDTLEGALHAAGFVQVPWTSRLPGASALARPNKPLVGGVAAIGVVLEVDTKAHPELFPIAQAIAEAFTKGGVPAFAFPEVKTLATNSKAIHLLVGQKA